MAPEPDAAGVGAAGAPSWSEALPARTAISSLSIIFWSRRVVMVACTSSKVRPALMASQVAWSSSPRVA